MSEAYFEGQGPCACGCFFPDATKVKDETGEERAIQPGEQGAGMAQAAGKRNQFSFALRGWNVGVLPIHWHRKDILEVGVGDIGKHDDPPFELRLLTPLCVLLSGRSYGGIMSAL